MHIVVNNGRTIHRAVKPGVKNADGSVIKPEIKRYGPTNLIRDVPDDEAKSLIARGFARPYEEPKAIIPDPPKAIIPDPPKDPATNSKSAK